MHLSSAGHKVAPHASEAAGLASKGDWTISALGPSGPRVPGSPYFCRCFGNQPGRVRPRRKLKANFAAGEALTFFDAKFAAKIQWRHWKDSALVCQRERWGDGRKEYRAAEPGQRRNAREGTSPSLFLANFSASSVKIISKVLRTPRMYLWVLHQGGGGFVKVADRALPGSGRPAESKKDLGRDLLPRGGMVRNPPGEPPVQSSLFTSKPRVNNLLPLHCKLPGAAPGSAGEAGTQSRPSRPPLRRLSPSPKTDLRRSERTSVIPAPMGCPDHHRLPPYSPERVLPPGSSSLGGLARAQSARAGWRGVGGGGRRSLRGACRRAGHGG